MGVNRSHPKSVGSSIYCPHAHTFLAGELPSGVEEKITLTPAEVGLTEATLRVSHRDSISSWTLVLLRDGSAVRTLTVLGKDTLLTDAGLEPSRTYTYSAVRIVDTTVTEKSNDLRVTTGLTKPVSRREKTHRS